MTENIIAQILAENLNIRCKYYNDDYCKRVDDDYGHCASCYGKIDRCDLTQKGLKGSESE